MHILNLSKRNGQAQNRMLAAAKALATIADLDPALVTALSPSVKDTAVRAMREREAVADLLEALAITAGVMPAESIQEPAADALEAVTPVTQDTAQSMEAVGSAPAESGEELPPPVVEETGEPARKIGGPVVEGMNYFIGEPGEVLFVPAAPKKSKRTTGGKKK